MKSNKMKGVDRLFTNPTSAWRVFFMTFSHLVLVGLVYTVYP